MVFFVFVLIVESELFKINILGFLMIVLVIDSFCFWLLDSVVLFLFICVWRLFVKNLIFFLKFVILIVKFNWLIFVLGLLIMIFFVIFFLNNICVWGI